jgi:hypothetical protein
MTDLRQLMHDTVDHRSADHVRLAVRARHGGATLRRRHRIATAGGSLAVLGVLLAVTAGGRTLLDRGPNLREGAQAAAIGHARLTPTLARLEHRFHGGGPHTPGVRGPQHGRTPHPKAGRELAKAVEVVFDHDMQGSVLGSTSAVRGYRYSAGMHAPTEFMAILTMTWRSGAPAGRMLAYWIPENGYAGAGGVAATRQQLQGCDADHPHCQTSTLPDGSLLRTTSYAHMNVAERDLGGTVEVLVAYEPHPTRGRVTGSTLSTAQLTEALSHLTPLT